MDNHDAGIGQRIGGRIGQEIEKEIRQGRCGERPVRRHYGGGGGAVYCLGVIGAAVYFIQHAHSFWGGVLGLLKAFVWPALLLYKGLGLAGF